MLPLMMMAKQPTQGELRIQSMKSRKKRSRNGKNGKGRQRRENQKKRSHLSMFLDLENVIGRDPETTFFTPARLWQKAS
jgi:hypothetical protein